MNAITVCVPVYNAAAFLADTLDSIAAQTFTDFKVLISLDRGDDDSEAICRRYLADRRFELIVQPRRLGWVGNVNALIDRVDTPFFCIMPHDDLLAPQYLAEIHALAASDPAIACAFSDMEGIRGRHRLMIMQDEIRGTPIERATDFMLNHFNAVAFRGIIRRHGPDDRPHLPTGLRGDYAADTVWVLRLALRGELRRLPAALYTKRFTKSSVLNIWCRATREEMLVLWAEQAVACGRMALEHFNAPQDHELILAAAWMRTIGKVSKRTAAPARRSETATATAIFRDAFGEVSITDEVLAHPNARHLRAVSARNALDGTLYPFHERLWLRLRNFFRA
jgi:glycosyltransferase involved in cell wall biosynthesis